MFIGNAYFAIPPKTCTQKSVVIVLQKICKETDPAPFYCELPEDLQFRSLSTSGTSVNYTPISGTTVSTWGTR